MGRHMLIKHLKNQKKLFLIVIFLWAPYENTAGHYIFVMWFLISAFFLSFVLSFFLSFFPCLISAVAHWMSTILSYMVWP